MNDGVICFIHTDLLAYLDDEKLNLTAPNTASSTCGFLRPKSSFIHSLITNPTLM